VFPRLCAYVSLLAVLKLVEQAVSAGDENLLLSSNEEDHPETVHLNDKIADLGVSSSMASLQQNVARK
jgi:hypothetical protein